MVMTTEGENFRRLKRLKVDSLPLNKIKLTNYATSQNSISTPVNPARDLDISLLHSFIDIYS